MSLKANTLDGTTGCKLGRHYLPLRVRCSGRLYLERIDPLDIGVI